MGKRASRRRLVERGRAVPLAGGGADPFGCGCPHLGRMLFDVLCPRCGNRNREEAVMPTSAEAGEIREVSLACSACGADAAGTARIVEVLPAH